MSNVHDVVVFRDRIGVLIGRGGEVKRRLEEELGVDITVDSGTGQVKIKRAEGEIDEFMEAINIERAIGYGFSPEKARRLLQEDHGLQIIDLTNHVGKSPKEISRVKARIIGDEGRTWRLIEETAEVDMTIYRSYVGLIGGYEELLVANEAIGMLIRGSPHKFVYNYLFRQREKRKTEKKKLWE
jgi:ribosomal RNA assembly protein